MRRYALDPGQSRRLVPYVRRTAAPWSAYSPRVATITTAITAVRRGSTTAMDPQQKWSRCHRKGRNPPTASVLCRPTYADYPAGLFTRPTL